jgi:hypothetical protein
MAGCASVIGVPNDTPSFCAQPANQGHAYCEDFDVGDPTTRWTYATGTWALKPSDDSPPNLIDLSAKAVPLDSDASVVTGFDKEFPLAPFGALHVEADVRFVTSSNTPAPTGILLITNTGGGCVAVAAGSGSISAIGLPTAEACTALVGGGGEPSGDAGKDAGPGLSMQVLGPLPPANQWSHMVIDVTPSAKGDGSGTFMLAIEGVPTGYTALPIPPGALSSTGHPLVGFSTAPRPGAGPTEVQYDNVTMDLKP